MSNWYYESHGEQKGPVSYDEMGRLVKSELVTRTTNVWTEGMVEWVQAGTIENLFQVPPPLPTSDGSPTDFHATSGIQLPATSNAVGQDDLSGLGGFLAVIGTTMAIYTVMQSAAFLATIVRNPELAIVYATSACLTTILLYKFFKKDRIFPKWFRNITVIGMILYTIEQYIKSEVIYLYEEPSGVELIFIYSIGLGLIRYVQQSNRVKNTFINH